MGCLQPARSVAQAELWGMLHALQWEYQLNHKQVVFEGDNKSVVELLQGSQAPPHWMDVGLISHCLSLGLHILRYGTVLLWNRCLYLVLTGTSF